jgi:hypothetical protein
LSSLCVVPQKRNKVFFHVYNKEFLVPLYCHVILYQHIQNNSRNLNSYYISVWQNHAIFSISIYCFEKIYFQFNSLKKIINSIFKFCCINLTFIITWCVWFSINFNGVSHEPISKSNWFTCFLIT